MSDTPDWVTRGKTVRQLISELQSFDDQDIEARISLNDGKTHHCISIVGKSGDYAVICNSEPTEDGLE